MNNQCRFSQLMLRAFLAAVLAAPFAVFFGLSRFVRPDHLNTVINVWLLGSSLYTVGFWLTFVLLRRRSIRPRSVGLWCWAVVCGLVAASFVPLGTALALPCLF